MRLHAFIVLFALAAAAGQQPPSPAGKTQTASPSSAAPQPASTKPTPAQVTKLLQLLRVRDDLQATLDAMKQQMKVDAAASFRDKVSNPTPEQLKSVNTIVDEAFAELSLDDLINDLVPVYQRHLTRSDVQALVAFYSSPAGQKIVREQPAMIRESMQAAGAAQQKRMEVMLAKVEVRMQQLADQQPDKQKPDK